MHFVTTPILNRQAMMDGPSDLRPARSSSANKPAGATEPSGSNRVTSRSEQCTTIDATSPQPHFSSRTNEDGDGISGDNDMPDECPKKKRKDDGSAPRKPAPKRALPPRSRKQPPKTTPPMRGQRIDSWATFPTPACSRATLPRSVPMKGAATFIEKPVHKRLFTLAVTERACKPYDKGSVALPEKPAPKQLFTIAAAAEGYSKITGLTR